MISAQHDVRHTSQHDHAWPTPGCSCRDRLDLLAQAGLQLLLEVPAQLAGAGQQVSCIPACRARLASLLVSWRWAKVHSCRSTANIRFLSVGLHCCHR